MKQIAKLYLKKANVKKTKQKQTRIKKKRLIWMLKARNWYGNLRNFQLNYLIEFNLYIDIILIVHMSCKAADESILLYGCTTWTLTKFMNRKLYSNCTRILQTVLNLSWRQHPTKQQLYGHRPPILKTIQTRRGRHAGDCWWSNS